jgi:hypothetical protein
MFRSPADAALLAELQAFSRFRQYIDKLRTAHDKAVADMLYANPQDLPARQGYTRCLNELIAELTKSPTSGE